MEDVWSMVHAERVALVDDLGSLDAARWDEPSLGGEWTVHDVVAHLVDTARTTRLGFMVGLARARFDFDRQNARGVERERGASPQETLARLRQVASRRRSDEPRSGARATVAGRHLKDTSVPLMVEAPASSIPRNLRA